MYKMILFDVDGVFLSEERCFDASALSVWELLFSPSFLALTSEDFTTTPTEEQIRTIRKQVFQDDMVLNWMKSRGMNANWDMVFLTFSSQLLLLLKELSQKDKDFVQQFLQTKIDQASMVILRQRLKETGLENFRPDFSQLPALYAAYPSVQKHELLTRLNQVAEQWFGFPVQQFARNSSLWQVGYTVYQEWYLGGKWFAESEKEVPRHPEKQGFLEQEIALADPEAIQYLLKRFRAQGTALGLGTGRPYIETKVPFETLGLWSLFDEQRIVTATDVTEVERRYPIHAPLGKPEPFTYVKGYLGRRATDQQCLSQSLPLSEGNQILIVGDSVADLYAARKMGCDFAATLTGLTGEEARGKFEELRANYIFDDVLGLEALLEV